MLGLGAQVQPERLAQAAKPASPASRLQRLDPGHDLSHSVQSLGVLVLESWLAVLLVPGLVLGRDSIACARLLQLSRAVI